MIIGEIYTENESQDIYKSIHKGMGDRLKKRLSDCWVKCYIKQMEWTNVANHERHAEHSPLIVIFLVAVPISFRMLHE